MTAIVIYFWAPEPGTVMMINGWAAIALLVGNAIVLVLSMGLSTILPAAPATNRKAYVPNSRFSRTPLPCGVVSGGARSAGLPATVS
jgi:hypothetical protein